MLVMEGGRARISPETARLLTVLAVSLAVLWALARVRFPARAAAANPVAPVLAQLAPDPPLVGIANAIAELLPAVSPLIAPVVWQSTDGATTVLAALRFRDDLAVLIAPAAGSVADETALVASDPGTGMTVLRLDKTPKSPPAVRVSTDGHIAVQYVFSTDLSSGELMLRPMLTGPLTLVNWPGWREPAASLPRAAADAGAYVFTDDGSLAGVVVTQNGRVGLASAEAVLAKANALALRGPRASADLGITVQALTAPLQAALGTSAALAVAFVDPDGPAAFQLASGDAIEALDGVPIDSLAAWRSAVAERAAFDTLHLKIRRDGEPLEAWITAAAAPENKIEAGSAHPLGLMLKRTPIGAEVLRVDPGSAGERAGIRPGDVISRIGTTGTPPPSDVLQQFAASGEGRPVLAVVSRGGSQLLAAFERIW
jgi:hypothetical protein